VIVAVLPSYNHLKKIIFELKKSPEFNSACDIRHIITKVHARDYYMNKNRNTYQFLIENCMKGVAHAVVFERPYDVSQGEAEIMQKSLENANFPQNVLPTQGRSFKLEDLAKILVLNIQHEKMNILYNKYFYGFEKEGKSAYFQEKTVTGVYFPYRYPFREDLLPTTLLAALNIPIRDPEALRPRDIEAEKKEAEEKENRLKRQLAELTSKEQRKHEREIKQQRKIEADLEPERLLKHEMDIVKRKVSPASFDIYIERIRGYVLVEGKEAEQNYELIANFNELSLRPMKNSAAMINPEDLGLLIYGRNLQGSTSENLLREVLKCSRTQLKNKK
jgi:hypothetical protein